MRISITYIHHNCFVLKTPGRAFLFDYPDDEHLPTGAPDMVRKAVAGTDLVVFISHGHGDHLNGNLASVTAVADSVRYVLSDDVDDMRPEAVPENGEVLHVEPDEAYVFHGLTVETLMSNDLGVAFLVTDGDFRFYYGGDLAEWIWEGAGPQEAGFTERFFRTALRRAQDFRPHVGFSNYDKRLPGMAGGDEACRTMGADVFVPMHTFGDTGYLEGFPERAGDCVSAVFLYARPGDRSAFDIG